MECKAEDLVSGPSSATYSSSLMFSRSLEISDFGFLDNELVEDPVQGEYFW